MKHLHILVATKQAFEFFVLALEQLLQISLKREIDSATNQVSYKFVDEQSWIVVHENDFENDINVPFELYNYILAIRAKYGGSWDETFALRNTLARRIFEKLKATKQYHLLLVENLQRALDEFDPNN